jgi:hypothetical protein
VKQLSFSLLDLIQFGDVVPFFNSGMKIKDTGRQEVHFYDFDHFLSHHNKLEEQYQLLSIELRDQYFVGKARGDLYSVYKAIVETQDVPTTVITADNIHEVKILLGDFVTLTKANVSRKIAPFKILHPHFLPVAMDRDSAKIFFDDIKAKRDLKTEVPQLSNWALSEIKAIFLKNYATQAPQKIVSPIAQNNSLRNSEEAKLGEDSTMAGTKPPSTIKMLSPVAEM